MGEEMRRFGAIVDNSVICSVMSDGVIAHGDRDGAKTRRGREEEDAHLCACPALLVS